MKKAPLVPFLFKNSRILQNSIVRKLTQKTQRAINNIMPFLIIITAIAANKSAIIFDKAMAPDLPNIFVTLSEK